jgi:hypothetical protein
VVSSSIILFDFKTSFYFNKDDFSFPTICFMLLIFFGLCVSHTLQEHFTDVKKMAINMKYIGIFQSGV